MIQLGVCVKSRRVRRRLAFAAAIGMTCTLLALNQARAAGDDREAKLLWAPPPLTNPITINLGDGTTHNTLRDDQDYIIKLPKTKKVGTTMIEGGRNIVIIGGYITLPVTDDKTNGANSRAIYIKNNVGIVHIEGVLIDVSGGGMSDGVDVSAPLSTVQVENVRVEGIYGYNDQFHADVIQTFGGVKDLRVDKLSGYSAYQGLTIDVDIGPTGSAEISRANLVALGDQTYGPHNNSGYMVWLTRDPGCHAVFPVKFRQVYIQPRRNTALYNAVWPPGGGRTACGAKVAPDDAEVTFPNLPITGRIRKGLPPQGDFVPAGVAGLGYVSPGYRSAPADWSD